MLGGGAAWDVIRIRQRPPLHLCEHALLVQQRLQETRVAVKLHQVEDLKESGGWKQNQVQEGKVKEENGLKKKKDMIIEKQSKKFTI